MSQKECRQSRCIAGVTIGRLALITLVVLSVATLAAGSPKEEEAPNVESTEIYQHTYDEVFQACQDAIERMGLSLSDKNKDKGTMSGKGQYALRAMPGTPLQWTFDVHIETLNAKPEVRVTINTLRPGKGGTKWQRAARINAGYFNVDFASEVHKVLVTYH